MSWRRSAPRGSGVEVGHAGPGDNELAEDRARFVWQGGSESDDGGDAGGASIGGESEGAKFAEVQMRVMSMSRSDGGGGGGGAGGSVDGGSSVSSDCASESDDVVEDYAGPLVRAPRIRALWGKRLSATTAAILEAQGHLASLLAGWDTYVMEAEFSRQVVARVRWMWSVLTLCVGRRPYQRCVLADELGQCAIYVLVLIPAAVCRACLCERRRAPQNWEISEERRGVCVGDRVARETYAQNVCQF